MLLLCLWITGIFSYFPLTGETSLGYHAPFMSARLPDFIDPRQMARVGRILEGELGVAGMDRLTSLLFSDAGKVDVKLMFDTDESGLGVIKGELNAELEMICQRCMQGMQVEISVDVMLGMINDGSQAEQLPESYEPLLVTGNEMKLADIVEDELILALPVVAMHSPEQCSVKQVVEFERDDEEQLTTQKQNPFAVLKTLKSDKGKQEN